VRRPAEFIEITFQQSNKSLGAPAAGTSARAPGQAPKAKSDNKFWDWFNEIKMNTIARKPVTISLLDEAGAPTMVWTLANAWPTAITGTDLKSDGNEVAIESIEISHEGLTIDNS